LELDFFDGFPYILTRVAPSIYHIAALPADLGLENLKQVARWQVGANKLDTCLVLCPDFCVYLDYSGTERVSDAIPRGGFNFINQLRLCRQFPATEDRCSRLKAYVDQHRPRGCFFGDISKGGRRASWVELRRLAHRQRNGVPVGLDRCGICRAWRGECLDPNPQFAGMVMRVRCRCENDTLCAQCGQPLYERRVNANFYSEADGQIWHVPGFAAFNHRCAATRCG
jgi:hypothetical protein